MVKKDISRGNMPKKLREKIRNINNGYSRARILVRSRKY